MRPEILIGCEFSGVVRDAFLSRGYSAWSCDILPTESAVKERHFQMDLLSCIYNYKWDMLIAFPPCTYLCNSGSRWLYSEEGRWEKMEKAANFFRHLLNAPIKHIALENPTPHKHAIQAIGKDYNQAIQPWCFGHNETKRTCFWLKNLPFLKPTNLAPGRDATRAEYGKSKDRWKKRSIMYHGIAEAMAEQWGAYVSN